MMIMTITEEFNGEEFTLVPNRILQSENGTLDSYDKVIYIILTHYCNKNEGICSPGVDTIARIAPCDRKRVMKSLHKLESLGLISKKRRGLGRTNVYTIEDVTKPEIQALFPLVDLKDAEVM